MTTKKKPTRKPARKKSTSKPRAKSRTKCMESGCTKPPELRSLWADGRALAWHCAPHHARWLAARKGTRMFELVGTKPVRNGRVPARWSDR